MMALRERGSLPLGGGGEGAHVIIRALKMRSTWETHFSLLGPHSLEAAY